MGDFGSAFQRRNRGFGSSRASSWSCYSACAVSKEYSYRIYNYESYSGLLIFKAPVLGVSSLDSTTSLCFLGRDIPRLKVIVIHTSFYFPNFEVEIIIYEGLSFVVKVAV